ncbi:MAG: iron-sulfur cluster assembly scaffold protein [Desulfohalobiaceae bacterium]|nr:iron-sulfur cluster assembly scaffold protein [Desulfohalobiaceae bacterium]
MTDALDDLVLKMQDEIYEQTRQDFGQKFLDHWTDPRHMGELENPSTEASLTGSCGDRISMTLKISGDSIEQIRFVTTGCGPSIACSDTACELAEGKDLETAAAMEGRDILEVLPRIPEDKQHCAHLAARTIREAISCYWKKIL